MNNVNFNNTIGKSLFQKSFRIAPLCFMTWMTLGYIAPVQAAVVADITQGQFPRVMANANGSLTVNINAASAGGVSHNKFTQFDVGREGLVLNNSAARSDTSVAGNIGGNKNMAGGAAGVIINEVTSNRVSQLNGKIEVAGTKADVIIANPAGVTCDGCGFINTGRSTLTTGTPQIDNGTLTGIKVSDGVITVTGRGMDDQSDYTALLARTVKIGALLYANDLQIMPGQYDNVTVANNRLTSTGAAEARADVIGLDVAELGGMYANKITLQVGQEGVGISNSGLISANTDLTITSNGLIRNAGMIEALGDTDISISDAFNNAQGTLRSNGDIYINSLATNNDGGMIQGDNINIVSGNVSNNNSDTYTPSQFVPRSLKDNTSAGGLRAKSDLIINSSHDIQGLKGVFSSDNGTVSLSAADMVNLPFANISAKDVNIFANVLSTGEAVHISGKTALRKTSTINATNDMNIISRDHYDSVGFLTAGNNLSLKSDGFIHNWNILSARKNVDIESGGAMTNLNTILSGADTTLKAPSVINLANGQILSGGNLTFVTNSFYKHPDSFISSTPIIKPY